MNSDNQGAKSNVRLSAERYDDMTYQRALDDSEGFVRGSAHFDNGELTVPGYPSIGRILNLERGLSEQVGERFWMEEKIDGYNVRIFRHHDRVLALTRGGFVCPFSTDRLADLFDLSFFDAHPEMVVCAEIAGPGTPYLEGSPPFIPEDVGLYVFDFMRLNRPGFVDPQEKDRLMAAHQLNAVPALGYFSVADIDRIRSIMVQLDESGREGAVFKEDGGRNRRAKYVTAQSSIADIRCTAGGMLELPAEYFTGRILRMVTFLEEQGLQAGSDIPQALGSAFLDGLNEAVAQYREVHQVFHRFRCRFRSRAAAEQLIEHFYHTQGKQQRTQVESLTQQADGYWLLVFDRVYPGMTGLLGHVLGGGAVYD